MKRSDYEGEEPEELFFDETMMQSWDVYCAMSTQWRVGACGATGLDYNCLPFLFKVYKIDDDEMALNDIRILEAKALDMMNAKK